MRINGMKSLLSIGLFTIVLLLLPSSYASRSLETRAVDGEVALHKNLLLIGWDGVQWEHLNEMLSAGRLPNLSGLIEKGTLLKLRITDHSTDTKSGWTQISTGLPAKISGVYSNSDYQPFPKGASIFESLEELTGYRVFTGFVAGKSHNLGSLGPGITYSENGLRGRTKSTGEGEPWYNAKGSFDLWYGDMPRKADEVGTVLLKMLKAYGRSNRFAVFAHFADPDSAGHKFGENSVEYEEAIIKCDDWLGRVLALLVKLDLWKETVLVVTTDHGFDEAKKSHKYAPDCFFAVNDRGGSFQEISDMKDIAPTILSLLGVPTS